MESRNAILGTVGVALLAVCPTGVGGDAVKDRAAEPGGVSSARLELARAGKTAYVVLLAADAPAQEKHAAEELAAFLQKVTGATFPVRAGADAGAGPFIAVGPGAARQATPTLKLEDLGNDGIVIQLSGRNLLLTGGPGSRRGTLYAVYTFIEEQAGVRWWTSKVTRISSTPSLSIPADLAQRYVPPFEFRDVPFRDSVDSPDFAVRLKCNGWAGPWQDKDSLVRGGSILTAGKVHSFYQFVPPSKHFAQHPEWFSADKDGRRYANEGGNWKYRGQLCLTNPELPAVLAEQAMECMRKEGRLDGVSVSQNDWGGRCLCAKCKAVEDEEGAPSGALVRFVNAVAERVEKVYPNAFVITLAYEYNRKPPKTTRPRPNVVVYLCNIECSFLQPLEDPKAKANQAFREDLEGWAKVCQRLWVWDYVTDYRHLIQPHPNLRVLGPNVRLFLRNNAKGVFELGNYDSLGGEFNELRTWVLAKLLWQPQLDDRVLVKEFVEGYYERAAPFILQYIEVLHDRAAATGYHLGCYSEPNAPFLSAELLIESEGLFQKAEAAVAGQPEVLARVQVAHLPVRYVAIVRWAALRADAEAKKLAWAFPATPLEAIEDFEKVRAENQITALSEHGRRTVAALRKELGGDGNRKK
jgi:hypothetical protein